MGEVLLKASAYVFVIALGYGLKMAGFFKPDDYRLIMKIALNITMPAAVITNFATFAFDNSLLYVSLLSLGVSLAMWGLGYLFSMGQGKKTRALYTLNFPGYNIGSFTMPYVQGFLGPVGVVVTCLFDAGNAVMCTGGSYALTSKVVGGKGQTLKETLKKLFSTPFCTYMLMLTLAIAGIAIPSWLLPITTTIGSANGFMAMLMVGTMFEFNPDKTFLKQAATILAVRYAMGAAFAALFYFALPFALEVRQVLAIVCFAPNSAMSPAFTEKLGGNHELSSFVGSVSILISIVIMTTLIGVMGLR